MISLFYTCVPNILIWPTVPEIQSVRLKLIIMGHFLPFHLPLKIQKNKIWKKWKKLLEISYFTCVPKPQSYEVQLLRYGMRQADFFVILGHYLPLFTHYLPIIYPPPKQNQKTKILKKWKKHLEMSSLDTYVPKITIIRSVCFGKK